MAEEDNRAIVRRAIEAFNKQADRSGYFDMYAADVELHRFPPGLPPGRTGLQAFYGLLWSAFPDGEITLDDLFAEGDRVAARFHMTGTHKGDFMGLAPTGRPVTIEGITILRFTNGECVERWNRIDDMGLMQQVRALAAQGG